MKIILLGFVAILLLLLSSIGLFKIFDTPFTSTEQTPEENPIEIINKEQLKIINPQCEQIGKQIRQVSQTKQTCEKDEECSPGIHRCDLVLNNKNHIKYHDLIDQQRTECGIVLVEFDTCVYKPPSTNYCVNNRCVTIENTDTQTLIDEFIYEHKKATQN